MAFLCISNNFPVFVIDKRFTTINSGFLKITVSFYLFGNYWRAEPYLRNLCMIVIIDFLSHIRYRLNLSMPDKNKVESLKKKLSRLDPKGRRMQTFNNVSLECA